MSNAAGSRRPPLRSASTIVAGTESGQHLLKIDGYSRTKDDFPTGSKIMSRPFSVGGHSWHLIYYPNGLRSEYADCVSIFFDVGSSGTQGVKAQYKFSLLDRAGRPSYSRSSGEAGIFHGTGGWGYPTFIKRDVLEKSEYLRDDCLTIVCDFAVFTELRKEDADVTAVEAAVVVPPPSPPPLAVPVPPSNLHSDLGGLLATGEGADVAFEVDGKMFKAHRSVLAARSQVFRAELFGPGKTSAVDVVRVDDMEAPDFEALLRYVYTDALPETKGGDAAAMLPDLLAAADRYKMDRLRLACEHELCEYVNGRTVAAMLAFASEHHCDGLKAKCLHFLNDAANLRAVVEGGGIEHLIVLKDLVAKLAAAQ
ncbi:hypothetical protein ABZP36_008191 [Zizania latifolia]